MVAGSELNGSQRCALAGKVASSLLGCTSRSTVSKSRNMAISVYLALTGPHLEHCDQFWFPHVEKLGRVPAEATRIIRGLENFPYEERLEEPGLLSLEKRGI